MYQKYTVKVLDFQTFKYVCCKNQTKFISREIYAKSFDGMSNNVEPDQTASK